DRTGLEPALGDLELLAAALDRRLGQTDPLRRLEPAEVCVRHLADQRQLDRPRRRARREKLRERRITRVAHASPEVELECRDAERDGTALENAALRGGDAAAERTARDDLRTRRIGGRIEIRHTVRAADTESAPRLLDLRDCSLEIAVALERGFDQRLEAGIVDEVPPAEQAGARAFERVAGVLCR